MTTKISIISLGCSKNLIDSEQMLGLLKSNDFILIDNHELSDIIIVNTCGFIGDAKQESIDVILNCSEYKIHGNCKYLIVTGCLSERYKSELMKEMPEIDAIIGTGNINDIVNVIEELNKGLNPIKVGNVNLEYNEEVERVFYNEGSTAYIKIAEGCDNYCTYCIIPMLRGKYRSRKIENIIKEAKNLAKNGVKEIILIAQDTTKYGIDLYGEYRLHNLLDELNKIDGIEWIRILYLYPDTFYDELIYSIKRNDKVVKYVDIPIQHINNDILKVMNRKTSKESIITLINKLRKEISDIIIRTTLIVGFPGETDGHFKELHEFVEEVKFDRLGVFAYSQEEGTAASKLPNQIDEDIKTKRKEKIMDLQRQISDKQNIKHIGNNFDVLIKEKIDDNDIYIGRTYMDSPDIDCIVYVYTSKTLEIGEFVKVKITNTLEYDLEGEM